MSRAFRLLISIPTIVLGFVVISVKLFLVPCTSFIPDNTFIIAGALVFFPLLCVFLIYKTEAPNAIFIALILASLIGYWSEDLVNDVNLMQRTFKKQATVEVLKSYHLSRRGWRAKINTSALNATTPVVTLPTGGELSKKEMNVQIGTGFLGFPLVCLLE